MFEFIKRFFMGVDPWFRTTVTIENEAAEK